MYTYVRVQFISITQKKLHLPAHYDEMHIGTDFYKKN